MKVKALKITSIVLMVITCIAFIVGITLSKNAEKEAATDITKIEVTITDKKAYYNPDESPYVNGCYHIQYTYKITNNTKVDWQYLKITTHIYDKTGKSLGTLTSEFGSSYGSSNFKLNVGATVTKDSDFSDNRPDNVFMTLYNSQLSDLTFESEVTYGTYVEK